MASAVLAAPDIEFVVRKQPFSGCGIHLFVIVLIAQQWYGHERREIGVVKVYQLVAKTIHFIRIHLDAIHSLWNKQAC